MEEDKDGEKNEQYHRSMINAKFNIAKSVSKMYSVDKNIRVEALKKSWNKYKEVSEYITTKAVPKDAFEKEL